MKATFITLALFSGTSFFAVRGAVVAHYSFDVDYTDASGNGPNGTPGGTAAISTEASAIAFGAGALTLAGTADTYIALNGIISFTATDQWTVSWWARRGELGSQKGMILGSAGTTSDFIWLNDNFGGLRFRSSTGSTFDFIAPNSLDLHHYALAADGAGGLTAYLDGQYSASLSSNTAFVIDSIGKAYPTTTLNYNFQGSLDELWIFNETLDATAVSNLKNYNSLVPEPSSVLLLAAAGLLLVPRRRPC